MLHERHFAVPDRVFFLIAGLVILATIVMAAWLWRLMPETLPAHFGWNGQPDDILNSRATIFFLIPFWQLLLTLLVAWAYRHPQFYHFPTRRTFSSFPPDTQRALVWMARHMLAVVLVTGVLIMAHLLEMVALAGVGLSVALSSGLMIWLVVFLVLVMVAYVAFMRRVIQRAGRTG